jgi:hypothetical protein
VSQVLLDRLDGTSLSLGVTVDWGVNYCKVTGEAWYSNELDWEYWILKGMGEYVTEVDYGEIIRIVS